MYMARRSKSRERMPDNLFKGLLSIDIIGQFPPFDIALRLPGHPAPLNFTDALCAWRREHCSERAESVGAEQQAVPGRVVAKSCERSGSDPCSGCGDAVSCTKSSQTGAKTCQR